MYNCVEYVIIVYAVLSLGGIITTSNPAYTAGTDSEIFISSNVKVCLHCAVAFPSPLDTNDGYKRFLH